jgi:precorrin-2 dehydrogenase / sirohydrochlorin ferrochelatase
VTGGDPASGYLPVALKLAGRQCVVVGGGEVAARRVRSLLEAGGVVTVVAPEIGPALSLLVNEGVVTHWASEYQSTGLRHAFLVIAATDQPEVNARVATDAAEAGVLCCDAETFERGDFVMPSVLRRGDLLLAVTTLGSSPSLAARVKAELEAAYGPEYTEFTALLGEAREKALREVGDSSRRRAVLNELARDESLLVLIREGRADEARVKAMSCISSLSD